MDESAAVRVCVQGRGAVGGQISTGKWAEESQGGGNIHGLGFSLVRSPVFLPVPEDRHIFALHTQTTESASWTEETGGWKGKGGRRWGGDVHPQWPPSRGGLGDLPLGKGQV